MTKVLFLTWDGPETNYVESLFLPIFKRLCDRYDYEFHILQFTWGDTQRIQRTKDSCHKAGIPYQAIMVSRKIPILGLLKAVYIQSKKVKKYIQKHQIDVVMPRATTSAGIVNHIIGNVRAKYLFDADGFSQDERVDFSGWNPNGFKYKVYRSIERKALQKSEAVLCRSEAAKEVLSQRGGVGFSKDKITVIANGKDTSQFSLISKEDFKPTHGIRCIYVGSLGPQYLLEEMLTIFSSILEKRTTSTFDLLTGNQDYAYDILNNQFPKLKSQITIQKVLPSEVPNYLAEADVAFSLRAPKFSMKGVCPIKLGEYLLSGVPVIANNGIGDTDRMLQGTHAGFLINDVAHIPLEEITNWCISVHGNYKIKDEARKVGTTFFDIEKTVALYHQSIAHVL